MDAKEILRLLIQNRFWIVLGIAALLPIIGYVVTAGEVQSQTESKAGEITSAESGAKKYTGGTVPNSQYAPITQKKIAEIEKDVNIAHSLLYDRQAPLLDWPELVAPQITAWGRDIPEDISENETQEVAYVYTKVYDDYAENVYKVVNPWDPATGEGIVVTPPMESLLSTVSFVEDITKLPSISKIWQYQENLWVRRSILEVIAEVNRKAGAKDWETAAIKQISRLDVGNRAAVDHRTTAEGFDLKDPPDVTKGGQALEPAAPKADAGGGDMMGGAMMGAQGMMGGGDEAGARMGGMPGMMGGGMMDMMGGGAGAATKSGEPVRFLQPDGVELFRDYPAYLSVLIDQNSIQNLLVEFENSPMTMRVLEANWTRPKTRVQPPVKGEGFAGMAGMGGFGMGMGGGLYGMDSGMMDMMGGGRMGGMPGMMGGGMMDMMGGGMMDMMGGGRMGGMPGMMGGMGGGTQPRSRVQRDLTSKAQQKSTSKEEGEDEKYSIYDPYYNIVELQVYVQARFYYPPTPVDGPADDLSPGDDLADDPGADLDDESMVDEALTDETMTPDLPLDDPADPEPTEVPLDESAEAPPTADLPLLDEPADPEPAADPEQAADPDDPESGN